MPKYVGWINNNVSFMFDFIHIIIDVVALGYMPYVHSKLRHTPSQEFFQSRPSNHSSIWN
jgi:hypothetical protein